MSQTIEVTQPSVVEFSQAELAAACRQWGPSLHVQALGLDGARVLWAISGVESSFGKNCHPRHEMGYCTGSLSRAPQVVSLFERYGHAAHASFGPLQVMLVNAQTTGNAEDTSCAPEDFADVGFGVMKAASFINAEILGRQGAKTLEEIADAYNSGNFRDAIVPHQYIADVLHNYESVPLPEGSTA